MVAPIDLGTIATGRGRAGFVVYGEDGSDYLGTFISSAGDINGDGFDDIIIGAYRADGIGNAKPTSGAAYVVFGKAGSFGPVIDIGAIIAGTGGFVIHGINAGDFLGGAGGAVGDFNGDGVGDFVVGAGSAGGTGASYVVFGTSPGSFSPTFDLEALTAGNGRAGFVVRGERAGDVAAFVASAGDVNGDGFDDLVIGAPFADGASASNSNSGSSYVVFGTNASLGATLDLASISAGNGSRGFVIRGERPSDFSGWGVASAGDVNGDGFGDLIIGAHGADSSTRGERTGASYVVFGMSGGFGATIDLTTIAAGTGAGGFVVVGQDANDAAGFSVSSAGDINGDGFADLLIGTDSGDGVGNLKFNSGSSYVLFGKNSGFAPVVDLASIASGNGTGGFEIFGEDSLDLAGWRVSVAGDVNGDGFDDILVGAPAADGANDAKAYAGSIYVVFGKAGGFGPSLNLSTITAGIGGFVIHGEDAGDRAGWNVGSAGDVNGDGFDDLAVGAIWNAGINDTTPRSGAAYVIFGRDFTNTVTHAGTARAETLNGTAGADVIVAGRGNDLILGNGGIDALNGGAGKDRIAISDFSFRRIDGGSDSDTLLLAGAGLALDLRQIPNSRLQNIEAIDLTGSGNNSLTLTALEVVNLSDTTNTLQVLGSIGDAVTFADSGWTVGGVAGGFRTYKQGAAKVLVADGIETFMVPVPADDAGNTLEAARVVKLGSAPISFNDYIGPTDANDFYRFTTSEITNFKLDLSGLAADANVRLLKSDGSVLRGALTPGIGSEAITVNELAAGTYYVRVNQGTSGAETNYALTMSAGDVPLNSSAKLFSLSGGKYATLALFSEAAYETEFHPGSPGGDEILRRLGANNGWKFLNSNDLPALGMDGNRFEKEFSRVLGGAGDASMLVARSADSLVLAFRGTDFGPSYGDVADWLDFERHYAELRDLVDQALTYAQTNSLTTVYVTGHSLGAAMVGKVMAAHPNAVGLSYDAVTFASPGANIDWVDSAPTRTVNFHHEDDPVNYVAYDTGVDALAGAVIFGAVVSALLQLPAIGVEAAKYVADQRASNKQAFGDDNTIYFGNSVNSANNFGPQHSMELYGKVMAFLADNYLTQTDIARFDSIVVPVSSDASSIQIALSDAKAGSWWAVDQGAALLSLGAVEIGAGEYFRYGKDNDSLDGNILKDLLIGGLGDDTLDGGLRADEMRGGKGDDLYIVDSVGDRVVERMDEGIADTVQVLNLDRYQLPVNVENLIYRAKPDGFPKPVLIGNDVSNTIQGNSLQGQIIDGGGGADHLTGGGKTDFTSDTFVFRHGQANGDVVNDFVADGFVGIYADDLLIFVGYGTEADGAAFVKVSDTQWEIRSASNGLIETISLPSDADVEHHEFGIDSKSYQFVDAYVL